MIRRFTLFLSEFCSQLRGETAKREHSLAEKCSRISDLQKHLASQGQELDETRERVAQVFNDLNQLQMHYDTLERDAISAVEDSERRIAELQDLVDLLKAESSRTNELAR